MRVPGLQRKKRATEIAPDEIFIDSTNLPDFDTSQFEGRLERPIGRGALWFGSLVLALLLVTYTGRAFDLMAVHGASYAKQAAENQLTQQTIFADRGAIVDRNGIELAYNTRSASSTADFASRAYAPYRGIAHAVGYVKAPAKDSSGVYYRDAFVGVDGAEQAFDGILKGQNGLVLTETNAQGTLVSQSAQQAPQTGGKVTLSIDATLTQGLYDAIASRAEEAHFQGGAGVIIDVHTGEILALTSYPGYSPETMVSGEQEALSALLADKRQPFLDRATNGLYSPGSIVKPFVSLAALTEGIISPDKQILSTGSISVPNPYDPAHPSVFKDWRAHGWVDMRHAIAVSSDVYFYAIGGGFQDQRGLGISMLDKYFQLFGFGSDSGLAGFSEQAGTIPTPAWKAANFDGEAWRLGNTYHTAIGQYGMQVTPLQAARAIAAVANGGELLTPTILASTTPQSTTLSIADTSFKIVQEGMRLSVTEGIAGAVKLPFVEVAAKTGTAQVGVHNEYINSWMIGFFPYENPKYAYAVVLERGPSGTLYGAPAVTGTFLQWVQENMPQYFK